MSEKSLSLSQINTSSFMWEKCQFKIQAPIQFKIKIQFKIQVPIQAPIQKDCLKENWKTFRNRGLHFIHLNINSLLTRIYELMEIVKISNPGVIRITETKINNLIRDSKISIDGYCAVLRDQNKKSGGVILYVTSKICDNTKNWVSNEIENIFIKLLIPKGKTNYSWNCL